MSSKRRKLDAQETPQSAVSAVSALAARRRLAAGGAAADASQSPSADEATPPLRRPNPFSVLQTLKPQSESASLTKGASRAARNDAQRSSANDTTHAQSVEQVAESIQYSSFRLTKRNYRLRPDDVAELRLENSERFIVLGSFGLRVLDGEVAVAGAALRSSETTHWIQAPLCHAVPVLRTSEHCHLEIHHDPNAHGLRKLDRLAPVFRRIWNEHRVDHRGRNPGKAPTFNIICSSEDAPKGAFIQELVSPPEWNKKLAALSPQIHSGFASTVIAGPKSAGKSTFSKLLINRLLTVSAASAPPQSSKGVALLDLDPGQPEYAPSGTLSLIHVVQPNLGTPFTHTSLDDAVNRVVRCHALSSASPASAPDFYLECAVDLVDTYRNILSNQPLVVNTPGWILGTGLDLLVEVIRHLYPQEVVYMSEDGPADTVDTLRAATTKSFTTLPSQQAEFTSRTAAHLRAMQTMSYFHIKEQDGDDSSRRPSWITSPLSSVPPWRIRYSGPNSGILGILSYDDQSPRDLLAETINGMVLAVVEIEDLRAFGSLSERPRETATMDGMNTEDADNAALTPLISRTSEGLPYIPNPRDIALSPRYSRTIGLILIRGIDQAGQSLQVITPIPQHKIDEVNSLGRNIVLVHGRFDTPTWAYTEGFYERSGGLDDEPESGGDGVELTDEDTSEDDSGAEPERMDEARDVTATPWVEVLKGNEKRPVGSRVWRVRRDLGRSAGE